MADRIEIVVGAGGKARFVHSDAAAELAAALGPLKARRASHVEPGEDGWWTVDLSPVGGPKELGRWRPYERDKALAAEVAWLREHHLGITHDACAES